MDAQVGVIGHSLKSGAERHSSFAKVLLILIAVTLFTRVGEINNPLTHVDDQFYLFTGKAMLNGELPYVDVWDRKPIGLFLIYAGIAALGGDSVIVYHLVGAAAALATAIAIYFLARRFVSSAGALRAGIVYLAILPTMGGGGGQSPVFYNLLIGIAALLAFDSFVRGKSVWPRAIAAMALVGIAIQIKPTTLFEGAFFALLFLVAQWRAEKTFAGVAALAVAMALTAGAPTAIAFAAYGILGHADAMWFATVVSIFMRTPLTWAERVGDFPQMALYLTVPALVTLSALATQFARGARPVTIFLAGWALAAIVGFLSVPNFFNHYTLPLILPMSVIMAIALADKRDGLILATMVAAVPILIEAPNPQAIVHNREGFDRTAALVRKELDGRCLYVFYGPTQLYTAANACHLSPYVFPDHLETEVESTALPVVPEAEVERIFAQRPGVVVTGHRKFLARNNRTAAIVERHLWCDYEVKHRIPASRGKTLDIWTLKPGPKGGCIGTPPPLGLIQSVSN